MEFGFTYEERLKQALSVSGYLTLISGSSKTVITTLCENVVGLDHLVKISGSDMLGPVDLWMQICTKAGMPCEGALREGDYKNDFTEETYSLTKEIVLNYFKEHNLVLLVDNFHYASEEMQIFMARQFKDAIRKGLRIIITSLPHQVSDMIRINPDLQGRISIINMNL